MTGLLPLRITASWPSSDVRQSSSFLSLLTRLDSLPRMAILILNVLVVDSIGEDLAGKRLQACCMIFDKLT